MLLFALIVIFAYFYFNVTDDFFNEYTTDTKIKIYNL